MGCDKLNKLDLKDALDNKQKVPPKKEPPKKEQPQRELNVWRTVHHHGHHGHVNNQKKSKFQEGKTRELNGRQSQNKRKTGRRSSWFF